VTHSGVQHTSSDAKRSASFRLTATAAALIVGAAGDHFLRGPAGSWRDSLIVGAMLAAMGWGFRALAKMPTPRGLLIRPGAWLLSRLLLAVIVVPLGVVLAPFGLARDLFVVVRR